ncbi:MAG: hypothetical protein ACFFC7_11380 [Candidatus Hermodarchaeota archaeon]
MPGHVVDLLPLGHVPVRSSYWSPLLSMHDGFYALYLSSLRTVRLCLRMHYDLE